MYAANTVWWDLSISINTSVSSHLVQTEPAIMSISGIVTSLLFSASVRAEVDLIAGDSCALLSTPYSNAEQSFMVILTSVARKSPFPKGSCHLTWTSTNSSLSTSPALLFDAGISPGSLQPNLFSSTLFSRPAFQGKIWWETSACVPYVIHQCFWKGSGVGFDWSCIKNTQAYCCQLHLLLFIRSDRWGYLKPPCFIHLVASQWISTELSLTLSSPGFLIRIQAAPLACLLCFCHGHTLCDL